MAVKKIQCADPHCDGVIAHQISDKTFELTGQGSHHDGQQLVNAGDVSEEP
jgi:hypothetical protein